MHVQDTPLAAWLVMILAALPLGLYLLRVLYPIYDSREPLVLRSKVAFVGHALRFSPENTLYGERTAVSKLKGVDEETGGQAGSKSKQMPICTLPLFDRKGYIINWPAMISAAKCNPHLSSLRSQGINMLGASAEEVTQVQGPGVPPSHVLSDHVGEGALGNGHRGVEDIRRSIERPSPGRTSPRDPARGRLAKRCHISGSDGGVVWRKDPTTPELLKFDKHEVAMSSGGIRSRGCCWPQRPSLTSHADLTAGESDIPWASLVSAAPSLIWLFANVLSRPDYVERVRAEMLQTTRLDGNFASVDVRQLVKQPFLKAGIFEAQRLYSKGDALRLVTEDTVLLDGNGREYLLKKGTPVLCPDRFPNTTEDAQRKRLDALISFGGGISICPGRHLAVAELMTTVGAMALVFEVEGVGVPRSAGHSMGASRCCRIGKRASELGEEKMGAYAAEIHRVLCF
ncbi:hypothetical protein VTI74DRAFT_8441 [Chaetomium olivicolor]